MRIVIQERLQDENYYDKLNFVGKQIFDFKFDFVFERLFVLDSEMTAEENANPNAEIRLIMEGDTVEDFILIKGYSNELSLKINQCFTYEDSVFFVSKIYQLAGDGRAN